MTAGRQCPTTGLWLIGNSGGYGYHVAKTEYPPLSAAPRTVDGAANLAHWGRYDIVGQTYYVAESRTCAYAEVLSPFKRANGAADPLSADAAFHGMTLEEYVEEVAREWDERNFMGLGAVPAGWRHDRGMYAVGLPEHGWLVDVEHPDSIAAVEAALERYLGDLGVPSLTTGVLRSEQREVITLIAQTLSGMVLDDGSTPMGVHFGSKHGAAWCKAFWLEHPDAGTSIIPLSPDPVLLTDAALIRAADRFRIRVF